MAKTTVARLTSELRARFDVPSGFRDPPALNSFATGVTAIDNVLRGGFPRGTLSEVSGGPSTNRTSLIVSVLSRALNTGECCVWIDAAGTFDPDSASAAGVPLERLLWINCKGQTEHALKATDLLLHGGGFGLVVFDLADTPESSVRRISMTSWFRLRHAAEQTDAALIALNRTAQTRSCSTVSVELSRQKSLWRGRLLRGISSILETRRHSGSQGAIFEAVR